MSSLKSKQGRGDWYMFHPHGSAVGDDGEIHNYNYFSCGEELKLSPEELKPLNDNKSDIGVANLSGYLSFVVTPNGSLQKYDPQTGVISLISNEMPSDPRDENRMNNIDPVRNNANHLINRYYYKISLFLKSLESASYENQHNK